MTACDLLEAELRLDRLEAQLAAELPAHVRAFARAYATGAPVPPAPRVGVVPLVHALAHPLLADRALALARVVVPAAIEADPAVAAAREVGQSSWPAYAALAWARDRAARAVVGRGFLDAMHALHGAVDPGGEGVAVEAVAGWREPDGVVATIGDVMARWHRLAIACGAAIEPIVVASQARPRAFVVEPRREVVIVVPATLATPAARFAALHELGHALVAALAPAGTPRVLDEAMASWTARAMEDPADPWFAPMAREARARRAQQARTLAAVERTLAPAGDRVPWALVHDPGAQAAYVAAEALADGISDDVGAWLAANRARIDAGSWAPG